MKFTHYKGEHRFLAIWALQKYKQRAMQCRFWRATRRQQYKLYNPRADETATGRLPEVLVRKVVGYLLAPQDLTLEFDLTEEGDTKALQGTLGFLCETFLKQPMLEIFHEPSQTEFAPLVWNRKETVPDGEDSRTFIDRASGEEVTVQGDWWTMVG
jgi:hypothetical protein